jgi:hypothetical protein
LSRSIITTVSEGLRPNLLPGRGSLSAHWVWAGHTAAPTLHKESCQSSACCKLIRSHVPVEVSSLKQLYGFLARPKFKCLGRYTFCIVLLTLQPLLLVTTKLCKNVASTSLDHTFASSLLYSSNYEGIRCAKQEQLWTQLAQKNPRSYC